MKMSHSLKTSLFVGAVALASLFSSCEKDDETTPNPEPKPIDPPVTEMPTDTIKGAEFKASVVGLSVFDFKNHNLVIAESTMIFSHLFLGTAKKADEATAIASLDIKINLPGDFGLATKLDATGNVTFTGLPGKVLLTATDPKNPSYKGVVNSIKFPANSEVNFETEKTLDNTTMMGLTREMILDDLRDAIIDLVGDANAKTDAGYGIKIEFSDKDGNKKEVKSASDINLDNEGTLLITGSIPCSTRIMNGLEALFANGPAMDGFGATIFPTNTKAAAYIFSKGPGIK